MEGSASTSASSSPPPFRWEDFIAAAEWLEKSAATATSVSTEALHRSAVSRAYYGAFQLGLAYLERKRVYSATGRGEDHAGVLTAFKTHSNHTYQKIGLSLDRLRDRRRMADYQLKVEGLDRMAQSSILEARKVVGYLRVI